MKKVVITGAKGTIGMVLRNGLSREYKIVPLDLPEADVTNYSTVLEKIQGSDAIIHLAWDTKTENFRSGIINPDNIKMVCNIYRGALEKGVKRVVMASSVHADTTYGWKGPGYASPQRKNQIPDSPYGASKVFLEALGKYYSQLGLEVVCIRFGGINPENIAPQEKDKDLDFYEKAVWFSHDDLVSLTKRCLEEKIPKNFVVIYGISNNKNRIHDYSNPFGWKPKDSVEKAKKDY